MGMIIGLSLNLRDYQISVIFVDFLTTLPANISSENRL